jgi:chaperonin GroEL (HSP60 family)
MSRLLSACSCSGGGAALLHASKTLDQIKDKLDNFDQKIGVTIIQVGSVTRCLY